MFSVLIFSLTINLSSGFNPDSTKVVDIASADTNYAESIRIADSNMTILNDCIEAKKYYKTALEFRPNDYYAKQKIEECNDLLNHDACGCPRDCQYQKIVKKAYEYFDTTNYLLARDYYLKAEELKPSDVYVKERIAICNEKLLGDAEYDSCIAEGDSSFVNGNYQRAWDFYKRALLIKDDAYPREQFSKCNEMLMEEMLDGDYKYDLYTANQLFESGDYQKAKQLYIRAASYKPDDSAAQEFISQRIAACDEKLKN